MARVFASRKRLGEPTAASTVGPVFGPISAQRSAPDA